MTNEGNQAIKGLRHRRISIGKTDQLATVDGYLVERSDVLINQRYRIPEFRNGCSGEDYCSGR